MNELNKVYDNKLPGVFISILVSNIQGQASLKSPYKTIQHLMANFIYFNFPCTFLQLTHQKQFLDQANKSRDLNFIYLFFQKGCTKYRQTWYQHLHYVSWIANKFSLNGSLKMVQTNGQLAHLIQKISLSSVTKTAFDYQSQIHNQDLLPQKISYHT